jgi:hypothetical protein
MEWVTMTTKGLRLMNKGWAIPSFDRRMHYFVEGLALCGKWAYTGALDNSDPEIKGPDDCVACRQKFDERVSANG